MLKLDYIGRKLAARRIDINAGRILPRKLDRHPCTNPDIEVMLRHHNIPDYWTHVNRVYDRWDHVLRYR